MLKASMKTTEGRRVVLGLSHENLKRLRRGESLWVDLDELGVTGVTCLIFSGKDETAMTEMVKSNIGAETRVVDRRPKWPFVEG